MIPHVGTPNEKRKYKRFRRARRRGRMTPAIATRISNRTRCNDWPVTKTVTRYHRHPRNWYFKTDWNEE